MKGNRILMLCGNESVVSVLMYGRSRDLFLQAGMREVAYLQAVGEFEVKVQYLKSEENRIYDWLLRWGNRGVRNAFRRFSRGRSLKQVLLSSNPFKFMHNW